MKISDVLNAKGADVVTVPPDAPVTRLLEVLAERHIGAVVVSPTGRDVHGIVSERDVVRHLHTDGPSVLDAPVSSVMTTDVITCSGDEDLEQLARTMTDNRFRHLPVVAGDELRGIVSIGDIVKARIDQLQAERDHLVAYIQQ